jgi:hypothetical protein
MSGIRIVLFDELYKTNSLAPSGIELLGQLRLDRWLGKDKVKFEVAQLAERQFKFTLWRTYGPWYEDPKRFSDCNETINSWDMNIFLGTDYQTGTEADFENHPGPYIISWGVQENFLRAMRDMAKKYYGTRINSIEVDNNLDHIDVIINY